MTTTKQSFTHTQNILNVLYVKRHYDVALPSICLNSGIVPKRLKILNSDGIFPVRALNVHVGGT